MQNHDGRNPVSLPSALLPRDSKHTTPTIHFFSSIPSEKDTGNCPVSPVGKQEAQRHLGICSQMQGDRPRVGLPQGPFQWQRGAEATFSPGIDCAAWPTSPSLGSTYIPAVTRGRIPGPSLRGKRQLLMQMHFELFGGSLL